jgi:hypothetical protein
MRYLEGLRKATKYSGKTVDNPRGGYLLNTNRTTLASIAAGSSLADFSTLKMEAIRSSEMTVHTRTTRCHIPDDGILQINK